ncbi:MAG: lytic transglycosylase domain-containing protein [bacterium]|nr:lytic transglycosylase domain-containing protein [bacterium]
MDLPVLIEACNQGAPVEIVRAIIQLESSRIPHALGINVPKGKKKPEMAAPQTVVEASLAAMEVISMGKGYSVDVGLMQVNTANLSRFGISVTEAFDPCTNIKAGTQVFLEGMRKVQEMGQYFPTEQSKIQGALSLYNTGSPWAGFENGYVARALHFITYGVDPESSSMEVNFNINNSQQTASDMEVDFTIPSDVKAGPEPGLDD